MRNHGQLASILASFGLDRLEVICFILGSLLKLCFICCSQSAMLQIGFMLCA